MTDDFITERDLYDLRPFEWRMVDDAGAPLTGLTLTVTISKNGAAFAAPTGTVAEIGNGWYKLTPSIGDVSNSGPFILNATGSGAEAYGERFLLKAVGFTPVGSLGSGNDDGVTVKPPTR